MQKLRIKIIGKKLHDIGYRIPLINKALSLGIDNFNTFNADLDDTQAVIAIIEADDEIIEEFKGFINTSHPEKAVIEKVLFEEYKNNVPPIERVLQSFQMEQWGKGIPILLQISETLKEFKNESNDNFDDLKTIMSKHDADASERILSIKREIIDIKDRLSNVEVAVSGL
jgi:acylphosphatase